LAYRIHYSDYATAVGPPNIPCPIVGPPGPQGPIGPQGPAGVGFFQLDLPSGQPDGTTDLSIYIQQAIDAAAGHGALVIPANANAYVIGTTLYIPSNTHLIIEAGATLFLKAGATGNMFLISDNQATQLGADNIYIELRGTLDGNAFNQTALPSAGIVNSGLVTNLYVDGFCQGLITNFANWPFSVVRCTNAEVRNLAMTNSNNSCEFASQPLSGTVVRCYNVGFTNCYIKDIRDVGLVLYGGITNGFIRGCYLDGSSASLYLDTSHPDGCVDCEISGCFAYNGFASIGVVAVIVGHNHNNARIFNNTIDNSGAGGLTISAVDYCEVYGNTVYNTGMQFASSSGQSGQVIISGATHVNFHDNAVRNPTTPGYYSRQTTNTIAGLVSYNPSTGAVSLTTTATHPINVGDQFRIFNAFGSGDYLSLNGWQTATAGTTGSTVNFTGPTGLTLATLKSGTINKYTNAVAVTIASGTYDPATGNVVLTTSAPHGMPMTAGVPQPFVVSGVTGTGPVANLNGYQTATTGTAGSTINFTTTANMAAMTITGGTVLPPAFGVSVTQVGYSRILNNSIGDWQTTPLMVACIGGQWAGGATHGIDGYTEGNVYGPRLATGPLYGSPADAMVYLPQLPFGSTQGVSYDAVLDVYYGSAFGRNITTQTFFPNKGLTVGWNLSSRLGEVDFLCGKLTGSGGFDFLQVTNDGTLAAVGVAGSLLANDGMGNTRLGGALLHGAMQIVASLANAGTVTVSASTSMVLIRNSASIATATIVLSTPLPNQFTTGAELELNFQNPVGALSWSGASVSNPPTAIAAAGASVSFINSGTTWLRRIAT
jgi:parallel beta-helix repeat protein